jgi:hypothetical protein
MRRELDATKHDLARSQADVARLQERCKMLEKTLKETRDLLRSRDEELEKMRRDRERERALLERRKSDIGTHTAHHTTKDLFPRHSSLDIRSSASDIARGVQMNGNGHINGNRRSQSLHRHLTQLDDLDLDLSSSDEDRARARTSEIYMTRIDSWSGAQVLQAVHDINSEILQFAASATEVFSFSSSPSSSTASSRSVQAMHDTSARIGPNLTRILSNRDHSQDPILVQLALQSCVSLCIARAFTSFCIGLPSKSDGVLSQIYARMRGSEPQPTASKWRALAHAHVHAIYPTLTEYSINELSDTILRWTADIFLITGCHQPDPSSHTPSSSPQSTRSISVSPPNTRTANMDTASALRARFTEHVRRISKAVLKLEKVARQETMSTCFEVVVADPLHPFVPEGMQDAFGEYGPSKGAVLATTELGLRCVSRVVMEREVGDVRLEERVLLQPKVVLESVLDVLGP